MHNLTMSDKFVKLMFKVHIPHPHKRRRQQIRSEMATNGGGQLQISTLSCWYISMTIKHGIIGESRQFRCDAVVSFLHSVSSTTVSGQIRVDSGPKTAPLIKLGLQFIHLTRTSTSFPLK